MASFNKHKCTWTQRGLTFPGIHIWTLAQWPAIGWRWVITESDSLLNALPTGGTARAPLLPVWIAPWNCKNSTECEITLNANLKHTDEWNSMDIHGSNKMAYLVLSEILFFPQCPPHFQQHICTLLNLRSEKHTFTTHTFISLECAVGSWSNSLWHLEKTLNSYSTILALHQNIK